MAKYFNKVGWLVIDSLHVLRLTDIEISTSRDTDEVTTNDDGFGKAFKSTYYNWSASCNGILSDSTVAILPSGNTNYSGATNAYAILEVVKEDEKECDFVIKIDTNNYQKGKVILTDFNISGQAGSAMSFSLSMQGQGKLVKSTS
jgi:predicted secreted protein